MLVLTRKTEEVLYIHTPDKHVIKIKITDIRKGQVKVGIEAPAYYAIQREEIMSQGAAIV